MRITRVIYTMCECGTSPFEIVLKDAGFIGSQWFLGKYEEMNKKEMSKSAGKDAMFFIFANGLYEMVIYPFIEKMIERHNLNMYGDNKPKYCMCRLYRNIILTIMQAIYSVATKGDSSSVLKDILSILNADIMTGVLNPSSDIEVEDCQCGSMKHEECKCKKEKHKESRLGEIVEALNDHKMLDIAHSIQQY